MKFNAATHCSKPGAVESKNPLGILIALAFFAGTPMWLGEEVLPFAPPAAEENPLLKKDDEK
jgi:hypothetical protein